MHQQRDDLLNPTLRKQLRLFRLDRNYVRGEGVWLYDENGQATLDFIAQYGAVPFGYNPDFIWEALSSARQRGIPALVQPSLPGEALRLANRLAALTPGELQYCTFGQSGAEAVEAALKLARSTTGRQLIVSAENSFHGKTLGALSATGKDSYQRPFAAPAPGFARVKFNDTAALEALFGAQGRDIAAFIVEPVQGEGGIHPATREFMQTAQRLCRQYEAVFIVDEIQTGLGRSGRLWACEHYDIEPDVLLLAKALGGGLLPLGVCVSSPRVWNEDFGHLHSSTFANNNITAAVGLAVLDHLEADGRALVRAVEQKGEYLLGRARELAAKYPGAVKEVRGLGLMLGVEFHDLRDCGSYDFFFLAEQGGFTALLAGFLLNVCGLRVAPFLNNSMTLRLEPALTITYEQIDQMLAALDLVGEILEKRNYALLYRYLIGDDTPPALIADYRSHYRSVKASALSPGEKPAHRFAFIVHYPEPEDVIKNNPSFAAWSREEIYRFMAWEAQTDDPGICCHLPALRSANGALVEGWLIGVPFGAREMMQGYGEAARRAVIRAVERAKELGADIVGLGALTSVITRGGRAATQRGIAVTSGNSFTTLMAVEALFKGARHMEIEPLRAKGGVLGAAGSIGRACALMMSERVASITLFGNPEHVVSSRRRLASLADEIINYARTRLIQGTCDGMAWWLKQLTDRLKQSPDRAARALLDQLSSAARLEWAEIEAWCAGVGLKAPLRFSLEVPRDLPGCDLVIAASNSPDYLIHADDLKSGAVVCDVARPADVEPLVCRQRDDVLVLEGGLVQYPEPVAFGPNLGYRDGVNLACLSETVLLCLEGDARDYSIGNRLSLDTVQYLRRIAERHGFKLAGLKMGERELDEREIDAIRQRSRQRRPGINGCILAPGD